MEYVWVLDPIDGTRAFISGVPVWGTLIGLYRNGKAVMGLVDQPFTGERYFADGEVSRYAGPDGADVGLVYVAYAGPDGVRAREHRFAGDRGEIRRQAVAAALALLAENV